MIFVPTVISSTSNINTITTITGANFVFFLFRLRFRFLFLFLFPFVGLFVRCVLSKPASSCTLLFYFLMVFHFCFLCHKHTSLVGKFQVKTTWKHALRVSHVKRGTDYNFCLCLLPFFFFTLCCILQRCE